MLTIAQACEAYLKLCAAERSSTSQHTYRWLAREFQRRWGPERPLASLSRQELQDWINIRKSEVRASTVRTEVSFYRRLVDLSCELGQELAAPRLRLPPVNNRRERVLTQAEQAGLKKVMNPWDFSLIEFVLNTGLRRLELFRLEQVHVQFFERDGRRMGMAKIATSKTGAERNCPLNAVAANIARVWLEARKCRWLFGRAQDNRFQEATWFDSAVFRPAMVRAGVTGFSFHCLRHTFATRALQGGARLEQISWALGHQTIEETRSRYAHWDEEQVWPAVLAVAQ